MKKDIRTEELSHPEQKSGSVRRDDELAHTESTRHGFFQLDPTPVPLSEATKRPLAKGDEDE